MSKKSAQLLPAFNKENLPDNVVGAMDDIMQASQQRIKRTKEKEWHSPKDLKEMLLEYAATRMNLQRHTTRHTVYGECDCL